MNISEKYNDYRLEHFTDFDQYKTRVCYFKGENIFEQGVLAPYVFYVVKGLVKVYVKTGRDKQINIVIAQPGDFLAFSSIFEENVHTYSSQALTEVEICMLEKNSLKKLLLENPDFAMGVSTKSYRIEKQLIDIIKNVSNKPMREKLASALVYLSQKYFLEKNVFSLLTLQDIADFASVSTKSAIKLLTEFEKEDAIRFDDRNIEITNREKLKNINKNE